MGRTGIGDRNRQARDEAMQVLTLTWGTYYEVREALGMCRAVRLGNGRTLIGKTPAELRIAIIRDYSEERHPR